VFNSPQLLHAITEALKEKETEDDSELDESSSAGATGNITLPETTKDALRVPEEVEWTTDLVLLKWHGTFVETDVNGDDNTDGFEREDDRKY